MGPKSPEESSKQTPLKSVGGLTRPRTAVRSVDCQSALSVVPVELALIVLRLHNFLPTYEIFEGEIHRKPGDGEAWEEVFRSPVCLGWIGYLGVKHRLLIKCETRGFSRLR